MNIKIVVAAHKVFDMPSDAMYVPVQAGALGKESIFEYRDDEGDNISSKNPFYSELTPMYWAWKNMDYDVLGLVHYRRYFTAKGRLAIDKQHPLNSVLSTDELKRLMDGVDIIAPGKRKYYIESIYSHYAHTLDETHLIKAKQVVDELFPEYSKYVQPVYDATSAHMFNMFIMKREYVEDYCSFLFPVLEKLEDMIDTSQMEAFDKRLFGRVSEILFNVWLLKKMDEGARVKEVKTMYTDKIDYYAKVKGFLAAKFFHKKYSKSF